MPIEIRELVIKTSISTDNKAQESTLSGQALAKLKKDIVQECLRSLKVKKSVDSLNR